MAMHKTQLRPVPHQNFVRREERVDAVTRAVEAVTTATQNAEKEPKQVQLEPVSNEWVPPWVPQQEAKIPSC